MIGNHVRHARGGCWHEVEIGHAIRPAALADVIGLPAEADGIDGATVGSEQSDGLAIFSEFEVGVQPNAVGSVLFYILICPDQEKSMGSDGGAGGIVHRGLPAGLSASA